MKKNQKYPSQSKLGTGQAKIKAGIFGNGEIGKAIAKFYGSTSHSTLKISDSMSSPQVKIKDLNRDDGLTGVEVLHICIPWSDKFIKIVEKEIKEIKPEITIIHSTIAPGTTKKLASKFGGRVVHSPVRGVHPYLYEGIKTFVKYIGADNKKAGELAKKYLEDLGIKTRVLASSMTSEALKIWDTTQYGWIIILNKEIKKWCDKNNVDFEAVYTEANKTYREGYEKLERYDVVRPYLKYMPGKIGGHCVIPNCHILDSYIAKIILRENELYK